MSDPAIDPEVQADMDAVDHHWTAHIKTAWMLYKCGTTLIGTLMAAKAWHQVKMRMAGPSQMLLIFNAIVCVLITAYKFTSKHIGPLFVLQTLSHYGFFLAFIVLVEYNENPQIVESGRKIIKKLTPLHALYGFVILYGYLKQSKCSDTSVYPMSFVMGDILFFVSFFACMRFQKKDLEACWAVNPTEHEKKAKELSDAQFDTFFSSFKKMAIWHALELVLGKILFKTVLQGAVTCGGNGKDWHYRSGLGHLFLMLHILGTVQALGMHRNVFIKNAKSAGVVPKTKKDLQKEEKAVEKAAAKEAKKEAKKDK